jgi:hypothetical protein
MKRSRKDILAIGTALLCITIVTSACTNASTEDASIVTLDFPDYPDYIFAVSPRDVVLVELYNDGLDSSFTLARGIAVRFFVDDLGFDFDLFNVDDAEQDWTIVSKQIGLEVDGKSVSDGTLVGGFEGELGAGLVVASWAPPLEKGIHTATFTITDASGQKLEYTWEFFLD